MASHPIFKIRFNIIFPYTPISMMCFTGSVFCANKEFVYLRRVFPQVLLLLDKDKYHSQHPCKIVHGMYLNAISCLSICRKSECESSQQMRSRCIYEGFSAGIICYGRVDSFRAANIITPCHYHQTLNFSFLFESTYLSVFCIKFSRYNFDAFLRELMGYPLISPQKNILEPSLLFLLGARTYRTII